MINIRTIRKLRENDGLTLKAGKIITYKSGWQVADYGLEARTAEEAIKAVKTAPKTGRNFIFNYLGVVHLIFLIDDSHNWVYN